jgi:hypothetical protein
MESSTLDIVRTAGRARGSVARSPSAFTLVSAGGQCKIPTRITWNRDCTITLTSPDSCRHATPTFAVPELTVIAPIIDTVPPPVEATPKPPLVDPPASVPDAWRLHSNEALPALRGGKVADPLSR